MIIMPLLPVGGDRRHLTTTTTRSISSAPLSGAGSLTESPPDFLSTFLVGQLSKSPAQIKEDEKNKK